MPAAAREGCDFCTRRDRRSRRQGRQGPGDDAAGNRCPRRCRPICSGSSDCTQRPGRRIRRVYLPDALEQKVSGGRRGVGLAVRVSRRSSVPRIRARAQSGVTTRHADDVQRVDAQGGTRGANTEALPPRTRSGTGLPRTCWRRDTTFARSRSCWGMRTCATTMIYTHVLNRGGRAVVSPLDVR